MQLIATVFLTVVFAFINAAVLSHIERATFETRVKQAKTILFGRFDWVLSRNESNPATQNIYHFIVYCTIKKTTAPSNVPRSIRVIIANDDTAMDMRKNRWFVLFPRISRTANVWIIDNRSEAFDLEDDLELQVFEQFCFLKSKLPIGFPSIGLLNRCPKPSAEYCLKNGTQIRRDELLELKTFLTSTTTRKAKVLKPSRALRSNPVAKQRQFIEPVW